MFTHIALRIFLPDVSSVSMYTTLLAVREVMVYTRVLTSQEKQFSPVMVP